MFDFNFRTGLRKCFSGNRGKRTPLVKQHRQRFTRLCVETLERCDLMNAVPTIGAFVFDNPQPRTNDVVQIRVVNAFDADNDPITFKYEFFVNNQMKQTTVTSDLFAMLDLSQPGFGDRGDLISAIVMSMDPYESGVPVTSSLTVANSVPLVEAVPREWIMGEAISGVLAGFTDLNADDGLVLYTGGSVGALTAAQFSGTVTPLHETRSGSLDPQTTFSYMIDVTGTTAIDGTSRYRQAYSYSFGSTSAGSAGAFQELSTYSYVFTATSSPSETWFSLVADLSYQQSGSQTAQTTGPEGATTTTIFNWQMGQAWRRELYNRTDLTTGAAQGSDLGSGVSTQSYSGSETYSYPASGGTVSGNSTQNGQALSNYSFAFAATQNANGARSFTGSRTANSSGEDHSTYLRAGSYDASGGDDQYGWTGTGTIIESGAENWSYDYGSSYDLAADGTWAVMSGSGLGQGSKTTDWSDDTSRDYSYLVAGGAVTGVWQERSNEHSQTATTKQWTLTTADLWITTGTWDNTTTGSWYSSYLGAGSYDASGGDAQYGWTGTGTINESGAENWMYSYGSSYDLAADGTWAVVSGSGSGSGGSSTIWSDTAGGDYGQPLDGGSLTGTWQASGENRGATSVEVIWTLGSDDLWTTTGSKTTTSNNDGQQSYTGSGSYLISSAYDASAYGSSTTFNSSASESGSQDWSFANADTTIYAAGGSVTTTVSSDSGASSASHTYSANNTTDAWSDWSDSGNSSHWESHDSWSQGANQQFASNWQESYTTVTDSAGSLTTGGASGDTDASGGSSFVTANHWLSNSTSTGVGYSSQSISNWSAAANAQDNYAYQANWSDGYDAAGMPTSSFSDNHHAWGSSSNSGASYWFNSWTPQGGVTTSASASSAASNSSSYNTNPDAAGIGSSGVPALAPAIVPYFLLGAVLAVAQLPTPTPQLPTNATDPSALCLLLSPAVGPAVIAGGPVVWVVAGGAALTLGSYYIAGPWIGEQIGNWYYPPEGGHPQYWRARIQYAGVLESCPVYVYGFGPTAAAAISNARDRVPKGCGDAGNYHHPRTWRLR